METALTLGLSDEYIFGEVVQRIAERVTDVIDRDSTPIVITADLLKQCMAMNLISGAIEGKLTERVISFISGLLSDRYN